MARTKKLHAANGVNFTPGTSLAGWLARQGRTEQQIRAYISEPRRIAVRIDTVNDDGA